MSRRLELFEKQARCDPVRPPSVRPSALRHRAANLDYAERMEDAALAAQRIAVGSSAGLTGTVRVTSPEWLGARILSPLLAKFCAGHPTVTVELVTDAEALSLTRREIDVALRFGRFQQDGLMQRKIASIPFELYAAAAYLKAKGPPDFSGGGADAALITMNAALAESVAEAKWLRRYLPLARVLFCSNSRDGQAAAAAAGAGLVCLPTRLASAYPELRSIKTPAPSRAAGVGWDFIATPARSGGFAPWWTSSPENSVNSPDASASCMAAIRP